MVTETTPDHGEWERCGWRVARPQSYLPQVVANFVRVSDGMVWFYLPIEIYEDLDDQAFTAIAAANRTRILRREAGTHVPGALPQPE